MAGLVNTHVAGDKRIQAWSEKGAAFQGLSMSASAFVDPGRAAARAEPSRTARATSISLGSDARELRTTSKDSYVAHAYAERAQRAASASLSSIDLSEATPSPWETTSKSSFAAPPPAAQLQHFVVEQKHAESLALGGSTRFYGETTSKMSYAAPGAQALSARAPNPAHMTKSLAGVMADDSTGQQQGQHEQQQSTSHAAFVAHPVPQRESPPVPAYEPSKAYFFGSTTSGESYKAWGAGKPERAQARASESAPSGGLFYGSTTSREAFQGLTGERAAKVVHGSSQRFEGAFDGNTTSRGAFRGWQLPKQRLPLGLETVNDGFAVIVPRNLTLPVRRSRVFTTVSDNQSSVEIVVRQGEALLASQNEVLATFELVGIAPARVGEPLIDVFFDIDETGVLHIEAKDKATGHSQHIAVDKAKNLSAFHVS
jgi:hypothetical protein